MHAPKSLAAVLVPAVWSLALLSAVAADPGNARPPGIVLPHGDEGVDYASFVVNEIELPADTMPTGIEWIEGTAWINDLASLRLLQLDLDEGTVTSRSEIGGFLPTGLGFGGGVLYLADLERDRFERLRPGASTRMSPIPYFGGWAWGLAFANEHLYAIDSRERKIHRIDPRDGTFVSSADAAGRQPTALAFDGRWLWSADNRDRRLYMLDPHDLRVLHFVPSPAVFTSGLAFDGEHLLVADLHRGSVYRVRRFAEPPAVEDRPERYRVELRLDVEVSGRGSAEQVETFVALPRSRHGQTILSEPRFEPPPARTVTDRWGQELAVFSFPRLEGGAVQPIRVSWEVEVRRVRFQLDPRRAPADSGEPPEGVGIFLADGRKYRTESAFIRELVERVVGQETDPLRRARLLYDHLAENIEYDLSAGWGAAPTVLERGTGSCSEYTFAYVSLCRAAGIPARYVGSLVNRAAAGGGIDTVFHRWAEVWLGEPWGWVPVDANHGASPRPEVRGEGFGGLGNSYLVTTVSGGESEYLDWSYNYNTEYQVRGDASVETHVVAIWHPLDLPGTVPGQ